LPTPEAAASYYAQQQQISAATVSSARKLFGRVTEDFDASYADVKPGLLRLVQRGRAAAASSSLDYTPALLRETGQDAAPHGLVSTARLLEAAPDGRNMSTLLDWPPIHAKIAVARGETPQAALLTAEKRLTRTLLTVMADTGRDVVAADIAQRPAITGYTRMLNPPSCNRCIILAGKWFRWNEGFLRHPRCDCRHIPASEDVASDLRTDPYAYFKSLDPEQQEKVFGRIEARAIREGADIYRVVNTGSAAKGGRGLATSKAGQRFGTPSRMTLDDIFRTAGTRTNAIKLMEREGIITGPQTAGGNIIGQREGFGQLGKGGRARAASDAVTKARATGQRDPLNRYTMTAAERRLYDAKVRLDVGRTGVMPRSIGANSADKYTRLDPITPRQMRLLEDSYADEVANLRYAADSVRNLAGLLGVPL
jgi:hypothetical protein